MKALKERGFESPYLRAFVVARINPLRFQRRREAPSLRRDPREDDRRPPPSSRPESVKAEQLARAGGAADDYGTLRGGGVMRTRSRF